MPQQYGSAAREPSYEPAAQANPFAPIDYAARLSQSAHAPAAQQPGSYQPGQLYGAPAPSYELPQELANEWQPDSAQQSAGVPYSSGLFERQPTGVMHASWEEGPFAAHSADWWQPEAQNEPPEQPPKQMYYSLDDIPLRDPFTPAQPGKEQRGKSTPPKKPASSKKKRAPVSAGNVLAVAAACVLLFISGVAGGSLIQELVQTSSDAQQFRDEYRQEHGVDVRFGAAKVDLLPAGETYEPTHTPQPTSVVVTPSPTPIIPVYGGVLGLSRSETTQPQQEQVTPTPVPRTRLSAYPDNPMCNIVESLRSQVEANADVIGHLVIPGVLDETVMQRTNTFYLTHGIDGLTSESGAVFADESCSLRLPPENLLLRGQGSVPGKTFAPLWQFVSGGKEFVAAHQKAQLTTLYEEAAYQLFAVIVADSSPSSQQYFNYASNPTFTTDEAMLQYVELARQHSLYKFNVDVNAGDRLLTLATLGDGQSSLVLIYRMQRSGE